MNDREERQDVFMAQRGPDRCFMLQTFAGLWSVSSLDEIRATNDLYRYDAPIRRACSPYDRGSSVANDSAKSVAGNDLALVVW